MEGFTYWIIQRLAPLMTYAAAAPATDPGEGYWDTIDTAFGCGERAAQYEAAEMIRGVLSSLGLDAPQGNPVCEGCSRPADGDEGHDPDCTAERHDD